MEKRNRPEFYPMRSVLYGDCVKEDYRVKLIDWLFRVHVPESISQFSPYVSKYAFYFALPFPKAAEKFGACRLHLCEHYWLANPNDIKNFRHHKAFTENMPMDVLRWQGNIPDTTDENINLEGDDARSLGGDGSENTRPFLFAFIPVWWEEDLKGEGRTVADGPNYRWQIAVRYPEGQETEADAWFMKEFLGKYAECEETTRILTSKVIQEANGCEFDRIAEIWFDGPSAWERALEKVEAGAAKPAWAETGCFPYLKKSYSIQSIFVPDYATSDNMNQYHGYITMR